MDSNGDPGVSGLRDGGQAERGSGEQNLFHKCPVVLVF
jgi:hypothetical protein